MQHMKMLLMQRLNGFRIAFPNKIDMSKITGCKPEETVGDFLTHLTILFNQHSGIPIPADFGNEPGAYETHLKQAFLNGLIPPLQADVSRTCIRIEDARLTEVRHHAEHVTEGSQGNGSTKKSATVTKSTAHYDTGHINTGRTNSRRWWHG